MKASFWIRLSMVSGIWLLASASGHCFWNSGAHETFTAAAQAAPQGQYGPFAICAAGPAAQSNAGRFSSKCPDDETGLHYYGYRYYSASTGKWLSRDVLEEKGGRNLYAFVENKPVNRWDILGQIGEGSEWPPPPNVIDPPPAGPFSRCRIAVICGPVYRFGVYLGDH
jgi:RHS repeat-associated protein